MTDIPKFLDRRPLVWSFSMLHCFRDICAHQGEARYITKTIKFVETPEIKWGNDVHTAFEYRLSGGKPLPANMQQWEGFAKPFDGLKPLVEIKLGVTAEGQSCGFFSDKPQVWGRGKLDVVVINGDSAYIPDWKTGNSKYEDPFELQVGAVLLQAKYPHLRTIKGNYIWLKEDRVGEMYDLSDTAATWKEICSIVTTINNYKAAAEFPKRSTPLCSWCQRYDCDKNSNPNKP